MSRRQILRLGCAELLFMDPPDHTRYRRLLTSQFTVRRMKKFEPRIAEIADERLRSMENLVPPVDLIAAFAWPLASAVIREVLGFAPGESEEIERMFAHAGDPGQNRSEAIRRLRERRCAFAEFIARKRAQDSDDVIGGLIRTGQLTDEELIGVLLLVIAAAHVTTSQMIALGTLALLRNPEQLYAIRSGNVPMDSAVEELLRYLSLFRIGPSRVALEDIPLNGEVIEAGDQVVVPLAAVNRDTTKFEGQPAALDVTRNARGHLAFGHGIHQCLGQQLARVELRIAYSKLLERLPNLRLAVPPDQVPLRTRSHVFVVDRLPVSW